MKLQFDPTTKKYMEYTIGKIYKRIALQFLLDVDMIKTFSPT